MNETGLTREQILEAAEEVLRRFGPAKATVVDVARMLGVSHGSVYRHFPSKAALRDAVAERWLARIAVPLEEIAAQDRPAPERLRHWLEQLIAAKRQRARNDPELFAAYMVLAGEAREVITAHVNHLCDQAARIIADGIRRGELTVTDPHAAGRAVFDATTLFHNPAHVAQWNDTTLETSFANIWALLLSGMTAPRS